MHDLSGHSQFFDRLRRVIINNSIELVVSGNRAVLHVGGVDPSAPKEEVVFTRPAAVSAFGILAQVLEEQGQSANPEAPRPIRLRWEPCPRCEGRGHLRDLEDNHLECELCHGSGIHRRW